MSYKISFTKLMEEKPTLLDHMINSHNQVVKFYEHPFEGDEAPIIAVFPYEAKAFSTDFYDLDDMLHNEDYEPIFTQGEFKLRYQLY